MAQYEREHFESAFQLLTAVSHQIIKIDFAEMERWVDALMAAKALNDPDKKKNMDNLKQVMRSFAGMQQMLYKHGIPVRDISHYKESLPPNVAIEVPVKKDPQDRPN